MMVRSMVYEMQHAPLRGLRVMCRGVDPRRYRVWMGSGDAGWRLWLIDKAPSSRGGAGRMYRVWLPDPVQGYRVQDLRHVARCDCPEYRAGARRLGGICKHVMMAYGWACAIAGTPMWHAIDAYLATQEGESWR